jgi:hypothetical protein
MVESLVPSSPDLSAIATRRPVTALEKASHAVLTQDVATGFAPCGYPVIS